MLQSRDDDVILQRLDQIQSELASHRNALHMLSRSAAGRGTVALGDGRIPTRMSLPEMFYGDPLFMLNADDLALLPHLIVDGFYEKNSTYYVCRRVPSAKLCIDVGANIGYYTAQSTRSESAVELTTIDVLTEPYGYRCDFIKIDTEGYEPKVLAGMARTIEHSPDLSIMMEWSPEQIVQVGLDVGAFCASLSESRFRLFTIGELGVLAEHPMAGLASLPYQNVVLERPSEDGIADA
jgi:hypothetical protein